MPRTSAETEILEAAAEWKERCMLHDGSVLSDRNLWTVESLKQLETYFVNNLDMGEGTFWEKLETQLGPASAAGKQLAAEMFWVLSVLSRPSDWRASSTPALSAVQGLYETKSRAAAR